MLATNYYGDDNDNNAGPIYVNYYGGDGNDVLNGTVATNEVCGGHGNDVVAGSSNLGTTGTGTAIDPFVFNSFLPSGDDILEGGAGDDVAYGADGNDKIYGGDGNDSGVFHGYLTSFFVGGLYGGDGNDSLYGGEGNDLLDGGAGTDRQDGGAGRDIFKFNLVTDSAVGSARDVIVDFAKSEGDIIDLRVIDAKTGGVDDAFKFIGKNGFHHKAGELRFSNHKVQGDTDGDGHADFEIGVLGLNKMAKFDFDL